MTGVRKTADTEAAKAAAVEAFLKGTKGEVRLLSDGGLDVEVLPTGTLSLDAALGVGGFPKGRIIEIYGPEHSGKTSVCLDLVGAVQASGGYAAFIDAEHALDPAWAQTFGVTKEKTAIYQPSSGEQGLDMAIDMCKSGAFDIIIIDSVAALTPQAELDGEMGDNLVGTHARMMSKALRKITGVASQTNTTVVFINQIREKIGGYGNPETTTGGKALRFYSSVRLEVRSPASNQLKKGTEVYGQTIKVAVKKNKVAAPFVTCEFDLIYGKGIDKVGCVLDAAEAAGAVIRPKGSSKYTLASTGEVLPATGKDNVKAWLGENDAVREQLIAAVYEKLKGEAEVFADEDPLEDEFEDWDPAAAG